jgi:hypothetical protein
LLLCEGIPWNCLGKESRRYNNALLLNQCEVDYKNLGNVLEKNADEIMTLFCLINVR